jgi:hypothetical protein
MNDSIMPAGKKCRQSFLCIPVMAALVFNEKDVLFFMISCYYNLWKCAISF